jgi:two-component system chemotaxis sensor kinase CheA
MEGRDQEVIREFLVESHENLSRLEREMVELEKRPREAALLASVFRTMHTIKGTAGFLGYATLEKLAHQAETLLSQLRDGQRELDAALTSVILEAVDAVRALLAAIEATGEEGPERFEELAARLQAAAGQPAEAPAAGAGRPAGAASARPDSPAAADSQLAAAAAAAEEPSRPSVADAHIRVGVGLLDKLMDLVGELVLVRNQILQFSGQREDGELAGASQRLNLITSELQEGVMKTRMQPIGMVWNQLPRVVRDMAVALGKQIRLEMEGSETELDRTIIEAIKDPLVHLVRNACDHGIEPPAARLRAGKPAQGVLALRAYHEGGQVNIEISDDGAGIDAGRVRRKAVEKGLLRPEQADKLSERETLNLIFHPGFSTADAVTRVSGRGVGMDVVKSHVEKIGGVVDIASRPGAGTTVKLKIPLTLAIIPGLVVTSGNCRSGLRRGSGEGERFIIPQASLLELIRVDPSSATQIEHIHGAPVYRRRGRLLPLVFLNEVLGLEAGGESGVRSIVVLQADDRQFGLVVDGIHDTQEIVVKPLGQQLKGLSVYAGATIMGDGRVALILDVLGIGQRAGVLGEAREQARTAAEQKALGGGERQRLLLFRSGSFERLALPLEVVARLEEFPRRLIERAAGCEVVQYRDGILPLVELRAVLEPRAPAPGPPPDPVQAIVFRDGGRSFGVVVDEILDIVEEEAAARQKAARPGLLGSAVVGGRVADFLDLGHVIREAGRSWWFEQAGPLAGRSVLVADQSPLARSLARAALEMAGCRVFEAAGRDEALACLERQAADAVLAALDLPPEGGAALVAAMRRRAEWRDVPVVALSGTSGPAAGVQAAGFADCRPKYDPEAVVETLARLARAVATSGSVPTPEGVAKEV